MRKYLAILAGETISLVGSGLTRFLMAVWVYQRWRSTSLFSLSLLAGLAPSLLALPVAGVLVDRSDRRKLLIALNAVAGTITLVLAYLLLHADLGFWTVCVFNILLSLTAAFQETALIAATGSLVDSKELGRVSGLSQAATSTATVAAPILTGLLVPMVGAAGIVLLDVASYLPAILALVLVRFPSPRAIREDLRSAPMWRGVAAGWAYIRGQNGLTPLLAYFATLNLCLNLAFVLITPLVLKFASPTTLGFVFATVSAGMVVGGILMALWGGPKQRVAGTLGSGAVFAICLALSGIRESAVLLAVSLFGAFVTLPIMNGCFRVIWQSSVPAEAHGRVAATLRVFAQVTAPVAMLVAGPLSDGVFEPLLRNGGSLTKSVGAILGTGPGRGTGLLFVLLGLLALVATFVTLYMSRTWSAELLSDA